MINKLSIRCSTLCAVFIGFSLVTTEASAEGTPGISPSTQFTPVVSQVLTTPQPVKASDGKYHVAYELLLTNAIGAEIEIAALEIRDAATGRVLSSLSGDDLQSEMTSIGKTGPDVTGSRLIPNSSTSIVWLDVTESSKSDFPKKIDHRVTGSATTPAGPHPFESIVSVLDLNLADPIVLGPPVPPGTWLMSEGCCKDYTHHRHGLAPINGSLYVPQRFAIDFFMLDEEHRTWIGDPHDLNSYLSYGKPVLAAAAGLVVAASDGRPDQKPPEPPPIPPIGDTVGNHAIIEVAPGTYLLYAHMKPGSLQVKAGDRVKTGQEIGLIGTTGNSTTPHLHFQVLTTPTFFPADSTPYVFDKFNLVGRETDRIWDDNLGLQPNGDIPFGPAANPGPRQEAMPLDRDIVTFE